MSDNNKYKTYKTTKYFDWKDRHSRKLTVHINQTILIDGKPTSKIILDDKSIVKHYPGCGYSDFMISNFIRLNSVIGKQLAKYLIHVKEFLDHDEYLIDFENK